MSNVNTPLFSLALIVNGLLEAVNYKVGVL